MEELNEQTVSSAAYTEENIRHLSDMEHVRTRPGMYIGRLGDGSQVEDGIYVLLKEVVDNSIDELRWEPENALTSRWKTTCVYPCVTTDEAFPWEVWSMPFPC